MKTNTALRCLLSVLLTVCLLCACAEPETGLLPSSDAEPESSAASAPEESSVSERGTAMSYEIPNNYNDAYTDAFAVSDYKPLEITASASAYTVTCRYSDGSIYRTHLVKKRWGVWMLGAMQYTGTDGKTVQMSDSSTDYEWVLSCGKTAGSVTFRGGNHGDYVLSDWNAEDSTKSNDRLLDMTFYDGKTGEKVELSEGETVTVNGLRVVIHTNIYEGEYAEENVLLNVEKRYLFNGKDVFVQSELYVAQDTVFKTTYTCMFPVAKKYGNCALFYNDDGTTKLVRTPVTGTSTYGNNFSDYNVASKVTLFGEEAPAYQMTVQIYNPADQFVQSERHTRLWDMNPVANKLYFSAFSSSPATVEKGTEWTFCSSWSFSYEPDFVLPEADELLGFTE